MLGVIEALNYETVNVCESAEDLKNAVEIIAGEDNLLEGHRRKYEVGEVQKYIDKVIEGTAPANTLTRKYGIRQQALYIKYYKDMEVLLETTKNEKLWAKNK